MNKFDLDRGNKLNREIELLERLDSELYHCFTKNDPQAISADILASLLQDYPSDFNLIAQAEMNHLITTVIVKVQNRMTTLREEFEAL